MEGSWWGQSREPGKSRSCLGLKENSEREFVLLHCDMDIGKCFPIHRGCSLGLLTLFSPGCLTLNPDNSSARTHHVRLGLPVNQADLP